MLFLKSPGVRLFQKSATLHVQLIRLGVAASAPGKPRLLVTRQLQPQAGGDLLSDLDLHELEVVARAPIVLAPQAGSVSGVDQLDTEHDLVTALFDGSGQDRLDAKLAADALRIDVFPFVAVG